MKKLAVFYLVLPLLLIGVTALSPQNSPRSAPTTRAAYVALHPEAKREVWRERLANLPVAKMSPEQAVLVRDLMGALDHIDFGRPSSDALVPFQGRMRALFSKKDARNLFSSLHRVDVAKSGDGFATVAPAESEGESCSCNIWNDFCDDDLTCIGGDSICEEKGIGCGILWMQPCDGKCKAQRD
jgi:hypothetical protein